MSETVLLNVIVKESTLHKLPVEVGFLEVLTPLLNEPKNPRITTGYIIHLALRVTCIRPPHSGIANIGRVEDA